MHQYNIYWECKHEYTSIMTVPGTRHITAPCGGFEKYYSRASTTTADISSSVLVNGVENGMDVMTEDSSYWWVIEESDINDQYQANGEKMIPMNQPMDMDKAHTHTHTHALHHQSPDMASAILTQCCELDIGKGFHQWIESDAVCDALDEHPHSSTPSTCSGNATAIHGDSQDHHGVSQDMEAILHSQDSGENRYVHSEDCVIHAQHTHLDLSAENSTRSAAEQAAFELEQSMGMVSTPAPLPRSTTPPLVSKHIPDNPSQEDGLVYSRVHGYRIKPEASADATTTTYKNILSDIKVTIILASYVTVYCNVCVVLYI